MSTGRHRVASWYENESWPADGHGWANAESYAGCVQKLRSNIRSWSLLRHRNCIGQLQICSRGLRIGYGHELFFATQLKVLCFYPNNLNINFNLTRDLQRKLNQRECSVNTLTFLMLRLFNNEPVVVYHSVKTVIEEVKIECMEFVPTYGR